MESQKITTLKIIIAVFAGLDILKIIAFIVLIVLVTRNFNNLTRSGIDSITILSMKRLFMGVEVGAQAPFPINLPISKE
jgi:hypothetical protein